MEEVSLYGDGPVGPGGTGARLLERLRQTARRPSAGGAGARDDADRGRIGAAFARVVAPVAAAVAFPLESGAETAAGGVCLAATNDCRGRPIRGRSGKEGLPPLLWRVSGDYEDSSLLGGHVAFRARAPAVRVGPVRPGGDR